MWIARDRDAVSGGRDGDMMAVAVMVMTILALALCAMDFAGKDFTCTDLIAGAAWVGCGGCGCGEHGSRSSGENVLHMIVSLKSNRESCGGWPGLSTGRSR